MSNTVITGLVTGVLLFAMSGIFLANAADTKADTNCDSSCDGFVDLGILFFFLGGCYSIGVAMGFLPPIARTFKRGKHA